MFFLCLRPFTGCGLKFVQLLQHFEHLGAALSSALEIFVNNYGVTSVVGDIMRCHWVFESVFLSALSSTTVCLVLGRSVVSTHVTCHVIRPVRAHTPSSLLNSPKKFRALWCQTSACYSAFSTERYVHRKLASADVLVNDLCLISGVLDAQQCVECAWRDGHAIA